MTNNTLGEHVKRFLSVKYNPETRAWYEKYLRLMVDFLGRNRTLSSVDRTHAEAYWQMIRTKDTCWESHPHRPTEKRELAPTTLANYLRAPRAFFNEMVRQREVEYNPFDHIKAPKDRRPVQMKAIAAEDLRAIWDEAKSSGMRDLAIITVLATTGMRAGELISMRLSRLELKDGYAWVEGKRGWRKAFLGQTAVQAIEAYLRQRSEYDADVLWLSANGEPLTTDGVRQMVDRLAERAGVTGRHNLHAFRHRVAQAWLDTGINAEIVAQALGHADVSVTLLIYGNQDETRVRSAVREAEMSPFKESCHGADIEPPMKWFGQ